MADASGRADESVLLRLQATGRPAPRLRLAGDDADPSDPQSPLRTTSRYEVVGEIAKGGVGVVLRGRDADLGRDVALKVLREDHAESVDLLRRFVEEAQVGGQLQHPGIVPVYELGLQPDGRPFFAMKLVKGGTLAAALAARKSPDDDRRRMLAVFEQICQTMAYVHSRGVVHRDLKPSNVMIGAFGEVQVVDWGFGKVLASGGVADERRAKREMKSATIVATVRSGSSGSDSLAGSVMGTPAYMPPEQALGQVDRVDERSDVFSLGAILCEILTGKPPYTGEDLLGQARQCRLKDAHARLHACGADDGLVKLAMECLAPLPKDRPKTADALAAAVDSYLSEADERAHRSKLHAIEAKAKASSARAASQDSRTEATERVKARRQTIVIAAAMLVVIAAAGVAWSSIAARRDARDRVSVAAVDDAIQDATRLAGAKDFVDALAATERARDLAAAEGVDPSLSAKADALAAEIRAGEAAARDDAARKAKDAAFLARLDDVRERALEDADPRRRAADFAAAFAAFGIDVDAAEPTQAATRLMGLGAEDATRVAAALDEWAILRTSDPRRVDAGAKRALAAASALDPDERRNKVRDAIAAGKADRLLGAASDPDTLSQPAATLLLLAQALRPVEDGAASLEFLSRAFFRRPGDFWIDYGLACRLVGAGRPGAGKAVRYAGAARALRPDSLGAVDVLARAQTLSGKPAYAIPLLEETIARAPADARLRDALSDAHRRNGESAAAVADAREAVRLEPGETRWRCGLATALVAACDPDEALAEARNVVRTASTQSRALACLGDVLLARGDVAKSVAAWTEAAHLDPRDARARTGLGRALAAEGDADGAERELAAALALDPSDGAAHWALACVRRDARGDLKAAADSCAEALRLLPGRESERAVLDDESGDVAFLREDLDAAQNSYEHALSVRPDDARGHAGLGTVFQTRGEHERAIVEFRAALAAVVDAERRRADVASYRSAFGLVPMQPRIRAGLGVSLRATGKLDEAIEEFRRAVDAQPGEWSHLYALGAALLEKGAARDALEPLRAAVKTKPDSAPAQDDLGRAALAVGLFDESLAAFRIAVTNDASLAEPHRHLGDALLDRAGDFPRAKDELEQARDIARDDPSIRLSLARALLATGDVDAALVELRAALHLDPDDADTLIALTRQLAAVGADDEAFAVVRETAQANPKSLQLRACWGAALMERGRIAEALTELRAARDGGATADKSWRHAAAAATWLAQAERLAVVETRLDQAVRDPNSVADAQDRLALAQLCASKGTFDSAVVFYRAAFSASPALADDAASGHRFAAVRAAARAAAAGATSPKPPAKSVVAAWRKQALEWLRAELAARRQQLVGADVRAAGEARGCLASWRRDAHFAALRDDVELANLPADERTAWRTLWQDVDAALAAK